MCSSDFVLRYPPDPSNNSENRNCDQHRYQARSSTCPEGVAEERCGPKPRPLERGVWSETFGLLLDHASGDTSPYTPHTIPSGICCAAQEPALRGFEDVVTNVGGGIGYLDADDLSVLIQFCRHMGRQFYAAGFFAFPDEDVEYVLFGKIPHIFIHT